MTALAIDGWNLDAFAALQWTVQPGLKLRLGYGLLWVPPITSTASGFDPLCRPPAPTAASTSSGPSARRPWRDVGRPRPRGAISGSAADLGLSFEWR